MAVNNPIYAIAGPTASGKTELGVELALRLGNGEIINCDSVQIYQEIQIATAKPTAEEMKGVLHHLIGYVSPEINYTADDWANDAGKKIIEIESRANIPILVGGTGFYLQTLREPLVETPKTDKKLRERLNKIREKKGAEHLHKILQRVDKKSADKNFPKDYPRVQRALEVYFQTGEKFSELQPKRKKQPEFAERIKVFVLKPPRDILYERINERAKRHFRNGLVEEVKMLLEKGLSDKKNALGSHGYRRVCEYLHGERTIESAIEKTQQDVRNYAKRQFSWFRREKDVIWLEGFGNEKATQEKLWEMLELK
ncbi:MAG: tRNA (adenosine(37)-N6)-dimethylallyltransferase MiaA [Acidobacteriota bacterium]|jgi:tRNA dimethylallyltransferase|nr:tRNA (adenosine(37)-N6)-dimethylallyltransferase MiaA [Acidobacteriota bacterium]